MMSASKLSANNLYWPQASGGSLLSVKCVKRSEPPAANKDSLPGRDSEGLFSFSFSFSFGGPPREPPAK